MEFHSFGVVLTWFSFFWSGLVNKNPPVTLFGVVVQKFTLQESEVLSDQGGGGFLGTQDLFFAHFTTFACAFFTVIFSNCLTIGYASFDQKKKKFKSIPSFSR